MNDAHKLVALRIRTNRRWYSSIAAPKRIGVNLRLGNQNDGRNQDCETVYDQRTCGRSLLYRPPRYQREDPTTGTAGGGTQVRRAAAGFQSLNANWAASGLDRASLVLITRKGWTHRIVRFNSLGASYTSKLRRASMSVSTIESSPNVAQELVVAKGLRQVAHDPRLQCASTNIIARVGGDQYGGNLFALQR